MKKRQLAKLSVLAGLSLFVPATKVIDLSGWTNFLIKRKVPGHVTEFQTPISSAKDRNFLALGFAFRYCFKDLVDLKYFIANEEDEQEISFVEMKELWGFSKYEPMIFISEKRAYIVSQNSVQITQNLG